MIECYLIPNGLMFGFAYHDSKEEEFAHTLEIFLGFFIIGFSFE